MSEATKTFERARDKVIGFIDELIDTELFTEWSEAANDLYKQQFAKKENPYSEAWDPRPGDDKRTVSYYKFGRITDVARDGFSMAVAAPNANRSCVPFEPRGLGAWRPKFDEILKNRARFLFRSVQP